MSFAKQQIQKIFRLFLERNVSLSTQQHKLGLLRYNLEILMLE